MEDRETLYGNKLSGGYGKFSGSVEGSEMLCIFTIAAVTLAFLAHTASNTYLKLKELKAKNQAKKSGEKEA